MQRRNKRRENCRRKDEAGKIKEQIDKVVKKGGGRERRKRGREQRVGSLECGKSRVGAHAVCVHPAPIAPSLSFSLCLTAAEEAHQLELN